MTKFGRIYTLMDVESLSSIQNSGACQLLLTFLFLANAPHERQHDLPEKCLKPVLDGGFNEPVLKMGHMSLIQQTLFAWQQLYQFLIV